MAELSKQALKVDNNQSFPNNNNGAITPSILRAFNTNMIDSTVNQDVYNTDSSSWTNSINSISAQTASYAISASVAAVDAAQQSQINQLIAFTGSVSSVATGSLLVTASALSNVITFTKGDNSTFDVTVADTTNLTPLNDFTASQLSKDATLATYTGSVNNSLSNLNTFTQSANTQLTNLASSQSIDNTKWNTLGTQSGSWVTESESGSFLITASVNLNTITFTKGNNTTFAITVNTGSGGGGTADLTSLNAFTASQLTINTGYNTYTSSTNSRLTNIESTTASINSSITQLNASSASQQVSINNLNTTTASLLVETQNLELFTASANTQFTSSTNSRLTNIESTTASLLVETQNLELFTSSQQTYNTNNDTKWSTLGGQSGSWVTESETGSFARYDVSNPWSANQTFTNITAVSASFTYVQTTYETSSVIYSSGSNQFGDSITDTQSLNGQTIVSGSLGVTGSFRNNTLLYPTTDGTVEQFLSTDGAGNLSFENVRTIYQNIRNREATTILKGTPLFASGSTGDNVDVYIADAGNPLRMPATLIAGDASLASGATGRAIIFGHIEGVDTNAYPAGTAVYVAVGGGWTATRPTGSSTPIQPLGVVTRQANNGMGIVMTETPFDLPNIQTGYAWVGNGNNQPVAVATSSFIENLSGYTTTASFNAYTQSNDTKWSNLASQSGSWITESETGSFAVNIGATTTPLQFQVNLGNGGENIVTLVQTPGIVFTGSFNAYTQSNDQKVNSLISATGSYATTGSNTFTGQQNIQNFLYIEEQGNPLIYTQFSQDLLTNKLVVNQAGASGIQLNAINVEMGQLTASLQEGYVWVGDSTGRTVTVATSSFGTTTNTGSFATTGSNTFIGNQYISGGVEINDQYAYLKLTSEFLGAKNGSTTFDQNPNSQTLRISQADGAIGIEIQTPVNISGSLTASLQEGYVWVGDNTGKTKLVATSSFIDTINTGSFATTGSNTFTGNQTVSASVFVSGTVKSWGNGFDFEFGTYTTDFLGGGFNLNPDKSISSLQMGGNQETNIEIFANGGNYDTFKVLVNSGSEGTKFQDFPAGVEYKTWMGVGTSPNTSNLGDITLYRDTIISGSLTASGSITLAPNYFVSASVMKVTSGLEMLDATYFRFLSGSSYYNMQLNPGSGDWAFSRSGVSNTKVLSLAGSVAATSSFENNSVRFLDTVPNVVFDTPVRILKGINSSVEITGSTNIRGEFYQSGSNSLPGGPNGATVGTHIQNRVLISDAPGALTPRLFISGSDGAYSEYGRGFQTLDTSKVSGLGAFIYTASPTNARTYNTVASITPDYSVDVEMTMFASTGSVGLADWDNGTTFNYVPFMEVAPNNGDNPAPQFKRSISVTGSVSITNVMNLKAQDPLPTGTIGDLAVSGSHIYFYNGAWTQLD